MPLLFAYATTWTRYLNIIFGVIKQFSLITFLSYSAVGWVLKVVFDQQKARLLTAENVSYIIADSVLIQPGCAGSSGFLFADATNRISHDVAQLVDWLTANTLLPKLGKESCNAHSWNCLEVKDNVHQRDSNQTKQDYNKVYCEM